MTDFIFRLYSLAHILAKRLLGRHVDSALKLVTPSVTIGARIHPVGNWMKFIENSVIKKEDGFNGFHYAGYILEKKEWCLPSWIWTNAAIVRLLTDLKDIKGATNLADKLLECQQPSGGWIVRNDYDALGAIPMLAPNDSAYIANNAMLSVYKATGDKKYLESAKKCAQWIIETCREDCMVYTGFNMRDKKWNVESIIVDVGFTAGLFSVLYELTEDTAYKMFLEKFIKCYIRLFYNSTAKGFTTSINRNDQPQGGMFSRGQAWALEGMIPAYKILNDEKVRSTIQNTIDNLIAKQNKDGSWPYNLTRPLMGNDCKGISVIAKALMEWYKISNDTTVYHAVKKAYDWCCKHTVIDGECNGGIFSFCTEGAVVKDLYTSCAFVYASAYAIELHNLIHNDEK